MHVIALKYFWEGRTKSFFHPITELSPTRPDQELIEPVSIHLQYKDKLIDIH